MAITQTGKVESNQHGERLRRVEMALEALRNVIKHNPGKWYSSKPIEHQLSMGPTEQQRSEKKTQKLFFSQCRCEGWEQEKQAEHQQDFCVEGHAKDQNYREILSSAEWPHLFLLLLLSMCMQGRQEFSPCLAAGPSKGWSQKSVYRSPHSSRWGFCELKTTVSYQRWCLTLGFECINENLVEQLIPKLLEDTYNHTETAVLPTPFR